MHLAQLYYAMSQGTGMLWGVWRDATIVGIINIGDIVPRTDGRCHFIFFDHKLADKRALCLSLMAWAFERFELHRLSAEIPTYARALAKFARKLGFRYEAEGREPYTHKDEHLEPLGLAKAYVGSRRFQATLYEGAWHDLLLLSVTREEFDKLYGRPKAATARPEADRAGPESARSKQPVPARVHAEPVESPEPAATDERAPATDRQPVG